MSRRPRPRPILRPDEEIDPDLIMAGSPFAVPESATPARRPDLSQAMAQGELRRFVVALAVILLVMLGISLALIRPG
jgi:hypothetical protein